MMRWYVLQTKPRKENLVFEQLRLRELEVYYPKIRVKASTPRAHKTRPYFPGYIFVHVDLDVFGRASIQWIPGTQKLLTYGSEPASVPASFVQMLRQKIDEINLTGDVPFPHLKHGDEVEINSGPFASYRAIFDTRLSGRDRVRVLLKMLQNRQVHVRLSVEQIEKIQ